MFRSIKTLYFALSPINYISKIILMESERSNSVAPQTPLNIEEEIFEFQYKDKLNGSIPPTDSQGESETCSLCNEPDPLFEPNRANLEPVARLSCHHNFHLRCIIISLKKDVGCPNCRQPIYLGDDDAQLNP